jgi:hypothetical protein
MISGFQSQEFAVKSSLKEDRDRAQVAREPSLSCLQALHARRLGRRHSTTAL